MYYATAADMEALDDLAVEEGLEILQMMELAGWHMLEVFELLSVRRGVSVTVLCGKGNKGGDGLSAARHLANHGWDVRVVMLDRDIPNSAEHHLDILQSMDVPVFDFSDDVLIDLGEDDVVIDALIGYHLEGAPRGVFADAVRAVNASSARVISYDIPTGLDATSGECYDPCVYAEATIVLGLLKQGMQSVEGREACGSMYLADIGLPAWMYDRISRGSRPEFTVHGVFGIRSL